MRYGIIGNKKNIFNMGIKNCDYVNISIEDFPNFLNKKEFEALNLTGKFRHEAVKLVDSFDESTKATNIVDTVINKNGKLIGYNARYISFLNFVKSNNIITKDDKVLIFGFQNVDVVKAMESLSPKAISLSYSYMVKDYDADVIINLLSYKTGSTTSQINFKKFKNCKAFIDFNMHYIRTLEELYAAKENIKVYSGGYIFAHKVYDTLNLFQEPMDIKEIYKNYALYNSNLVLIGMPSAGKTSFGKYLANSMSKKFIDVDEEITRKIQMPIYEFIEKFGENSFRELEMRAIADISNVKDAVIATGGGSILNEENIINLKKNGFIIFIDRALRDLTVNDERPLSKDRTLLEKMYEERMPLYEKYSEKAVLNGGEFKSVAENIKNAYMYLIDNREV